MSAGDGTPAGDGIDTADVERWRGVPLGGIRMRHPVSASDIARWAQAMDDPNPLHFDPDHAAGSRFGGIVAPQSFTVAAGDGHGIVPALQGRIEGSHALAGGDEWWFFGPPVRPGDRLSTDCMLFDHRVAQTRFAGPTVIARGDTTYANQRGELVAKQRCTAVRYLVEEARRRGLLAGDAEEPSWSTEELDRLEAARRAYHRTVLDRGHEPRPWASVAVGDVLPTRPIGPHSVASLTTDHRARPATVRGAVVDERAAAPPWDVGRAPEPRPDPAGVAVTPAASGALGALGAGPELGHVDAGFARRVGLPRGCAHGSSMGAWVLDHLGGWAGEWARVEHSVVRYRRPALTGDATYLHGTVVAVHVDEQTGWQMVRVAVEMRDQHGGQLARGSADLHFLE